MMRPALSLLIALSLSALPAVAQDRLTLQAAIGKALAENPQMRVAESRIRAAQARETQAAAWPNPNFSLSLEEAPFTSPMGGTLLAGVSQPLLLGPQRAARHEAAKLERVLAELERDVLKRDLAMQVKEAYAHVLFAQENVHNARQGREAAETMLTAVQRRFQAGEVPRVEVIRAEVERSKAERAVTATEGKLSQEQARLNVLLGNEAQEPVSVQALPLPTEAPLPTPEALVARSLGSRLELKQAELAIQREAVQRQLAQSGMWTGTQVSIAAGSVEGQPGFSTSLSVPIPFYRQQGEVAEAEADRQRAEAERDALLHRITLEVEQAYREAKTTSKQIELFRKSYLPQATRLVDNAQRRFLAGEGSGLDVIEARHALRETQAEYQAAILEYRQAVASLERAIGQDLASSIVGGRP